MFEKDKEIKDKLININKGIEEKYKNISDLSDEEFREILNKHIGRLKKLDKLSKSELSSIEKKGGIVGIDGSTNRKGGSYPHYIEIYQALAKSSKYKDEPIYLSEIYTPILEKNIEEDKDIKNKLLARIEILAGIESAKNHKPYVIMMDGGLIRYNIEAGDSWREFVDLCIKEDIILIGVIKDIKTSLISQELINTYEGFYETTYDKELLHGRMDYMEGLFIREDVNTKEPEGYYSAFIRSAKSLDIVGMDILEEQKDYIEEMARLVISLTPENSRGVPLWLDIVDEEVKISDMYMEGLLEEYLDPIIYNKFFISERDKRN